MGRSQLGAAIPQLPTAHLVSTEDFFVSFLGFEVLARYADKGYLILKRGDAEIHFWLTESEAEARRIAEKTSCYIRVENIETLFEEFKANEVPLRYGLEIMPWGMREMQVDDPYGNAIRFGERV